MENYSSDTHQGSLIDSCSDDPCALKHVVSWSNSEAPLPGSAQQELVVTRVAAELAARTHDVGRDIAEIGREETSYYAALQ